MPENSHDKGSLNSDGQQFLTITSKLKLLSTNKKNKYMVMEKSSNKRQRKPNGQPRNTSNIGHMTKSKDQKQMS